MAALGIPLSLKFSYSFALIYFWYTLLRIFSFMIFGKFDFWVSWMKKHFGCNFLIYKSRCPNNYSILYLLELIPSVSDVLRISKLVWLICWEFNLLITVFRIFLWYFLVHKSCINYNFAFLQLWPLHPLNIDNTLKILVTVDHSFSCKMS